MFLLWFPHNGNLILLLTLIIMSSFGFPLNVVIFNSAYFSVTQTSYSYLHIIGFFFHLPWTKHWSQWIFWDNKMFAAWHRTWPLSQNISVYTIIMKPWFHTNGSLKISYVRNILSPYLQKSRTCIRMYFQQDILH